MKGGLGNQLFQYAAAYSLAKKHNDTVCFDVSYYKKQSLRSFKLQYLNTCYSSIYDSKTLPLSCKISKTKVINYLIRFFKIPILRGKKDFISLFDVGEVTLEKYKNIQSKNIYMDGYFLTELYFLEHREDLLKQITQKYDLDLNYSTMVSEIKACNSVAVHIRRGDYLKKGYKKKSHYSLGINYYLKCIDYINSHVDNPVFFFFSDDILWVKESFGMNDNYRFVSIESDHPDIDELLLMKNCKNMIAANSTFSWWAAWLNENDNPLIVVPARKYGPDNMVPKRWKRIEP